MVFDSLIKKTEIYKQAEANAKRASDACASVQRDRDRLRAFVNKIANGRNKALATEAKSIVHG